MEQRGLDGAWSMVLGASAGMGRSTALQLAAAGSNVVGVHFDTASQQAAVDEVVAGVTACGVEAVFVNGNAASADVRADVIARTADRVGADGLRVLLHSLAFGSLVPYLPDGDGDGATVTGRQMAMTLEVMAHSLVYWVQDLFAADLLVAGSKVFAMTSAGTARIARSYGPVSAAKSALESHVRQLAVEAAPRGVSVNAIRAGVTLTESFLRIPGSDEISERARRGNPHGRLTTPDDVAEAVVLLARARSSWITGNVIGVDGGEILTV